MQKRIIHQYVDIIIITRHLYVILPTHKGKTGSHFHEEFLYMLHQTDFHITLIVVVGESQHIEYIWVFEHGFYIVRFRCRQGFSEIVCQRSMLAVIIKSDGFLQIACRPMIGNALHHIPIPCANILDLLYQNKIMRPIQILDGKSKIIFV